MLEQYQPYPNYKYSGEQWIGDIPSSWSVQKLKHLFVEKKHKQNLSLQCGAISFGKVVTKDDDKVPFSTKASYQEVLTGEFLINPLNLNYDLKSLRIALSDKNVMVSAGYIVLKHKSPVNKSYFKYLLHRYDVAFMKLLGSGVRQTISFNHIAESLLLLPSQQEQTAIANFLDDKTEKIERAIAIKEKQIELLKERKQILIQNAVTRGLNPDAPMKDSGVDWIGEIPAHWEVLKFKFSLSTKARLGWRGLKADEYLDKSDYLFLSTPNIKHEKIQYHKAYHISQFRYEESPEIMLMEGDVLLVKDGSTLGISNIIRELPAKCTVNSSIAVLRIFDKSKTLPQYLNYYLKSETIQNLVALKKDGMGVPHLFQRDINNFSHPIPPLQEQYKILEFLDKNIEKLRTVEKHQIKQIRRLKEYKASLINSAVTGKIKVPT